MNTIHRTGCISALSEEIHRLQNKSERTNDNIVQYKKVKNAVDKEIDNLKAALENILSTEDVV